MTLVPLLEQLRTLDEHARLEVKKASQLGGSVLETVCAFANEPGLNGGTILLGIERLNNGMDPPDYVVRGVSDPDKVQTDLVSQCRSVFNVPVSVTIAAEQTEGKTVLVVTVPEALPAAKPVRFIRKPLPGGAFRRLGSADVKCTEDDIAILYQRRGSLPFDASPVEDSGPDDIDPHAVAMYRTSRARGNPAAEELQFDDIDLLRALRCLDLTPSGPCLTIAGLILFGKALAQRRLLPMLRLDYVRVPGREWVPEEGERFATTLDMRGPLLLLLGRAQAAIVDDLPGAFHLPDNSMQRRDEPPLPSRVIREAVVNAAMHRSYRTQQPAQIVRYANRLEIRNPGYSLKAPERLGEPGSEPRNPTIAAVLHELNFAETKGTGIRIMQTEMRRAGLTPPAFHSDRGADTFTATFLFHHFLDEADTAFLGRFRHFDLSDAMLKALVYVREQGSINNAVYRDLTQAHPADATKDLRRLRTLDLLHPEGNTTRRIYLPGGALRLAMEASAEAAGSADGDPTTAGGETAIQDSGSAIQDNGPTIQDSGPAIQDSGPAIQDNGPAIQDSGPAIQDSGPAIQDSGSTIQDNRPAIQDSGPAIQDNGSTIQDNGPTIQDNGPTIQDSEPDQPADALDMADSPIMPAHILSVLNGLGKRIPPETLRSVILILCSWRALSVARLARYLGRSEPHTRAVVAELVKAGRLGLTREDQPRHPDQTYRTVTNGGG